MIEQLKITYSSQSKKLTEDVIVDHIFNVYEKFYPEVLDRLGYTAQSGLSGTSWWSALLLLNLWNQ